MSSSYYEIRVSGVLPPEALLDFDRLTASVEPVETVVHGLVRDQAALNGLLARLEAFGVQILEIRRLRGQGPRSLLTTAVRRPSAASDREASLPAVPPGARRPARGHVRHRTKPIGAETPSGQSGAGAG